MRLFSALWLAAQFYCEVFEGTIETSQAKFAKSDKSDEMIWLGRFCIKDFGTASITLPTSPPNFKTCSSAQGEGCSCLNNTMCVPGLLCSRGKCKLNATLEAAQQKYPDLMDGYPAGADDFMLLWWIDGPEFWEFYRSRSGTQCRELVKTASWAFTVQYPHNFLTLAYVEIAKNRSIPVSHSGEQVRLRAGGQRYYTIVAVRCEGAVPSTKYRISVQNAFDDGSRSHFGYDIRGAYYFVIFMMVVYFLLANFCFYIWSTTRFGALAIRRRMTSAMSASCVLRLLSLILIFTHLGMFSADGVGVSQLVDGAYVLEIIATTLLNYIFFHCIRGLGFQQMWPQTNIKYCTGFVIVAGPFVIMVIHFVYHVMTKRAPAAYWDYDSIPIGLLHLNNFFSAVVCWRSFKKAEPHHSYRKVYRNLMFISTGVKLAESLLGAVMWGVSLHWRMKCVMVLTYLIDIPRVWLTGWVFQVYNPQFPLVPADVYRSKSEEPDVVARKKRHWANAVNAANNAYRDRPGQQKSLLASLKQKQHSRQTSLESQLDSLETFCPDDEAPMVEARVRRYRTPPANRIRAHADDTPTKNNPIVATENLKRTLDMSEFMVQSGKPRPGTSKSISQSQGDQTISTKLDETTSHDDTKSPNKELVDEALPGEIATELWPTKGLSFQQKRPPFMPSESLAKRSLLPPLKSRQATTSSFQGRHADALPLTRPPLHSLSELVKGDAELLDSNTVAGQSIQTVTSESDLPGLGLGQPI